jgi:hypothetical protein
MKEKTTTIYTKFLYEYFNSYVYLYKQFSLIHIYMYVRICPSKMLATKTTQLNLNGLSAVPDNISLYLAKNEMVICRKIR